MDKVTNVSLNVWGDKEEIRVLEECLGDASDFASVQELEQKAVDMVMASKYSVFDIRGMVGGEKFIIFYENSVLMADGCIGRHKINLPDGLITIEDLTSNLEEYAETAGFDDYYNRVLKNWTEDQIRDNHARIFEDVYREV